MHSILEIDISGDRKWYLNSKLYREDGPAVEFANGTKVWYVDDKLHRINGPAIEFANGYKEWWLNGENYTEKKYYEVNINSI